ncbi:probable LRR receptor-like serine/threonine-protein kinase At4g36180 [Malania oleifera]|uniref:probable LRR receptor-like serine/threonine-protein kinase At4g36180 n=1 Tax=Malania oleifera TaxID=397392 RepID=UPI0025AE5B8B|nr:probable LRR receptor-like serine/threonine-protein kinase At4g36180 [Malania oleifera]
MYAPSEFPLNLHGQWRTTKRSLIAMLPSLAFMDVSSFLFLVVLFAPFLSYAQRSAETAAEIEALTAFKLNLHDPVGALSGWDSSTPSAPCDWRGVACYGGRVTEIRLPRLQLGGRLTDRIADLNHLRRLSLRSNSFNGTIPPSLAKCTLLRSVFLQYNSFSGALPVEFGNLTDLLVLNVAGNLLTGGISGNFPRSLRYFDVSSNQLSGEIPRSFANASQLQLINLSYNQFSGAIPAGFGELQRLQYLWLDYNLLEGPLPSAIANCSSLVHLSVQGNALGGVIPAAIGALPKLEVISLSENNLSGSVPSSMFCNVSVYPPSLRTVQLGFNAFADIVAPKTTTCFSALQVLDLQHNQIRGDFPLWITYLSSLTVLDVSGNSISGAVPSEIGNLSRLEELRMANNSLEGVVPMEIMNCSFLRVLDLEENGFSGETPSFFGELNGLMILSIGGNRFSGSIPESYGDLLMLETLNLRHNSLSGGLPDKLMGLSNLTTMDISENKFSGEIPENIGKMAQLMALNMSGNGLSGHIPASVGSLYRLTTLDLSRQNLSGELPFELSGLPNLQIIALQENALSGNVPEGFSSLLSLRFLNLTSNGFSGNIPATFGFLRSLAVLSLSYNLISGSIPPEVSNCSDLRILSLRSNYLTGRIPADLSGLSHLNELDLGRNNLTGEIPEKISRCSSLTSLLLDGNDLSGGIPESLSNLSSLTTMDLSMNNLTGRISPKFALISALVHFNVSFNNLQGEIPASLGSRFKNPSLFAMNQNLCGKPLERKCQSTTDGDSKRVTLLFVVVACGAFLSAMCCCFYIISLLRWRQRLKEGSAAGGEKKPSPGRASSVGRGSTDNGGPKLVMFNNKITLAETIEATRQFDEENVLSRTRYGLVFKACFNDGMVLSIRRLRNGSLDENMFRKEAESLGKVKHRNLTVLRGYYAGPPDVRLLVYDYMPNGNLATLLQEASHQDGNVLNWPMRHLIALGVARGLAFLHAANLVHGDVKPQNVLFDADFEAHLSDFGLDRFEVATPAEASTSTAVGSLGYVSPEAASTGETTKESDIYSFGIVLLELLTGKRPVMFTQDEDIVKWVKRQLQKGQISELLEPGLLDLDPESSEWEEFLLGVKVALLCTAADPMDRPIMADVVFMLEGCRAGPDIASSADPTAQPSPA